MITTLQEFNLLRLALDMAVIALRKSSEQETDDEAAMVDNTFYIRFLDLQQKFPPLSDSEMDDLSHGING